MKSHLTSSRPWALVASLLGGLLSLPPAEGFDRRAAGTVRVLVTAADGSVLTSRLHGAELDEPAHSDMGTVAYFDLSLDW